MIEDIHNAIRRERAWLLGLQALSIRDDTPGASVESAAELRMERVYFKPAQVTVMLRVEVTRDRESDLWRELRDFDPAYSNTLRGLDGHEGPATLDGVAVYIVWRLPEPGWRVINPMRARS
jgi:hypothetical protein